MSLVIGTVYSFNTIAPALLGARIEKVRLDSIMNYAVASKLEPIHIKFKQIYTLLPTGSANDPSKWLYYLFTTQNNEQIILCNAWIENSTIEVINSEIVNISIVGCSQQDKQIVINLLNTMNLTYIVS